MKQQFIPSIYSYCDRWCERCSFTKRCSTYEGLYSLSGGKPEFSNRAFWDSIAEQLKKAKNLLSQVANIPGLGFLDVLSEEERAAWEEKEEHIKKQGRAHVLGAISDQYVKLTKAFLLARENYDPKIRQMEDEFRCGFKSRDDIQGEVACLKDCLQVIHWYVFFIDAKLQRALRGKRVDDDKHVSMRDADGSAKVALIGIDRSISAWVQFYELMPDSEDMAIQALSLLSQLKQKTLAEFPHAMEFKRPGFDD